METVFNPATFFPAELFGSFDGLHKASAERTKRLESLNLKLAETLMKKQAEFINHAVDPRRQFLVRSHVQGSPERGP